MIQAMGVHGDRLEITLRGETHVFLRGDVLAIKSDQLTFPSLIDEALNRRLSEHIADRVRLPADALLLIADWDTGEVCHATIGHGGHDVDT